MRILRRSAAPGMTSAIALVALAVASIPQPAHAGINVRTSNGPEGGEVHALPIDPVTPSTLYAGPGNQGSGFKNTDGGSTWSAVNADSADYALAIDPTTASGLAPPVTDAVTAGPCGFVEVIAGADHTCGLRPDDTVECWGDNRDGESTPPTGAFSQVSAGVFNTCGLRPDGTVECWGVNDYGQSTPPTGTFSQVSAGFKYACGLRPDGTVTCWGDNSSGQSTPPAGAF